MWFRLLSLTEQLLTRSRAALQGKVVNDTAYLTQVGTFEVDVAIEGRVVLTRQKDQPGLIAGVAQVLAEDNVNVAYMTVSRLSKGAPQHIL